MEPCHQEFQEDVQERLEERLGMGCSVLLDSWAGWAHNLSKGQLCPLEKSIAGQEFQEPMKMIP